MRRVRLAALALLSGFSLSCAPPHAHAAETAFNIYPHGSLTLGAGSTPPPGLYITPLVGYYEGSISGDVTIGRVVALDLNVKFLNDIAAEQRQVKRQSRANARQGPDFSDIARGWRKAEYGWLRLQDSNVDRLSGPDGPGWEIPS
jgi:hypothetical protein